MEEWMAEANQQRADPAGGLQCDLCRKEQPRQEVRFFQVPANLRSSGLVMNARSLFLCRRCWEQKG